MGHLDEHMSSQVVKEFNSFQLKIQQLHDLNRIMAHNLRGAASNIQMMVNALEEMKKSNSATDNEYGLTTEEIYTFIKRSNNSMIITLEKLMEMNKKSLRDDELTFETCDIKETVAHICSQLSGSLLKKKTNIQLNLEQKELLYPKVYLESIIYNIVSNAIKYSDPGRPLHISIVSRRIDGHQVIEIQDNGIGIDMKNHQSKMFRPFQTVNKNKESTGLGLYMVKTQVEALGGHINVESQPNVGTKFIVQL